MKTVLSVFVAVAFLGCGDTKNYYVYGSDAGEIEECDPATNDAGVEPEEPDAEVVAVPDAGVGIEDSGVVTMEPDAEVVPLVEVRADNIITLAELSDFPRDTPALVRTVIRGSAPVDLLARFVGFEPNPLTGNTADRYITLETDPSDARWSGWGGAAAGMSGSPVIIDGRVAGALGFSRGSRREPPFPFIATPVEKMQRVDAESEEYASRGPIDEGVRFASSVLSGGGSRFLTNTEDYFSGRDSRFVTNFTDVVPYGGGGGGIDDDTITSFVPGSTITVHLLHGDLVNLFALGTVTLIDEDRIWAFGHPFMWTGAVDLPFSGGTISSIATDAWATGYSFKVGQAAGPNLGHITNDRSAAISGHLGEEAQTFPVTATIRLGNDPWSYYTHQVARFPNINLAGADAGYLATIAMVAPLDTLRDYYGPGSVDYTYTTYFDESEELLTRTGIASNYIDPVGGVFWDAIMVLGWGISQNPDVELTINRVELTATLFDERREILVYDIDAPDEIVVGPLGADLEVSAIIARPPFEDSVFEERIPLAIHLPPDFPAGDALISVGADLFDPAPTSTGTNPPQTADDVVRNYNQSPRTDVLKAIVTSVAVSIECTPELCGSCVLPTCEPTDCPPCDEFTCPVCDSPACETMCDPCPCDELPAPPWTKAELELDSRVVGNFSRTITVNVVR